MHCSPSASGKVNPSASASSARENSAAGWSPRIAQMQGMVVAAIADIDLARARYAYAAGYGDVAVGTADSPQGVSSGHSHRGIHRS